MKTFILISVCLSFSFTLNSMIYYVKLGAAGDGLSWESPMGNLHAALSLALEGDEIWVASGIYYPVECNKCTHLERTIKFTVPSGVKLYGGFYGNEDSIDKRDWKKNRTILSGNIGHEEDFDNSFTVVYFENADRTNTLDGFYIMEGKANVDDQNDLRKRFGGGILNVSTSFDGTSSPLIRNCRIMYNYAIEGAGICNYSVAGSAFIFVENCSFIRNKAEKNGGGILDMNIENLHHSSISKSEFVLNEALYGASYFSKNKIGNKKIFNDCRFLKNTSIKKNQLQIHDTNHENKSTAGYTIIKN